MAVKILPLCFFLSISIRTLKTHKDLSSFLRYSNHIHSSTLQDVVSLFNEAGEDYIKFRKKEDASYISGFEKCVKEFIEE